MLISRVITCSHIVLNIAWTNNETGVNEIWIKYSVHNISEHCLQLASRFTVQNWGNGTIFRFVNYTHLPKEPIKNYISFLCMSAVGHLCIDTQTRTYTHTHLWIYIQREREGGSGGEIDGLIHKDRQTDRARRRERDRQCDGQ